MCLLISLKKKKKKASGTRPGVLQQKFPREGGKRKEDGSGSPRIGGGGKGLSRPIRITNKVRGQKKGEKKGEGGAFKILPLARKRE